MQTWMDLSLKYSNKHGRPTTDNPKAKLPVVSTDTDGVLANWVRGYLKVFNEKFNTNLTEEQWTDDRPWMIDPPLMTIERFQEGFDAMLKVPEFYLNLEPYSDINFKKINEDLDDALYNFYAVTVRVNLLSKEGITDNCMQFRPAAEFIERRV
jgi:hypothetical protein